MSFADAMNGFFKGVGGGRQLGLDLGDLYNEGKLGAQKGLAFREAEAEAKRLNDSMVDVNVGTERIDPASGSALTPAEARAYRQEEGAIAGSRVKTEQRRQADVSGDMSAEALYLTKYLPDRVKAMRSAGDDKLADGLEKYIATDVGQRHARIAANFAKAQMSGNFDAAAKAMEDFQELSGEGRAKVRHLGNGAYAMQITNLATGKTDEYQVDGDKMTGRLGLAAYTDPANMYTQFYEQEKAKATNLAAVTKAKIEREGRLAEKGLDFNYDVARDNLKYQQDIAKMDREYQLKGSAPTDEQKTYQWLASILGLPQEKLDGYIGNIIKGKGGGDEQAKLQMAKQYLSDRLRSGDREFNKLTPEEQVGQAVEYATRLQSATAQKPNPPAAGAASGLPPIWPNNFK